MNNSRLLLKNSYRTTQDYYITLKAPQQERINPRTKIFQTGFEPMVQVDFFTCGEQITGLQGLLWPIARNCNTCEKRLGHIKSNLNIMTQVAVSKSLSRSPLEPHVIGEILHLFLKHLLSVWSRSLAPSLIRLSGLVTKRKFFFFSSSFLPFLKLVSPAGWVERWK